MWMLKSLNVIEAEINRCLDNRYERGGKVMVR